MKKFSKLAGVTATVMAAAMVLSSTAMADETFKIGGIGPITGAAAVYGQAVMNASQMAADEINAAGGINGYQIEFNFQDDEHDAEKSVNAYNTLKDWGMQMLLGTVTSTPCTAVAAKTSEDNLFHLQYRVLRETMHSVYVSLTRTRVLHPLSTLVKMAWLKK